MIVLLDTTDAAQVLQLTAETIEAGRLEAFEMIPADDKRGCNDITDYEDTLGPSQWYRVVELTGPTAK